MPPGVGHLATFEDDVIDRSRRQALTHCKPRVAGTDDDDVPVPASGGRCGCVDHRISTATLVGFVTMSNTAERRCD